MSSKSQAGYGSKLKNSEDFMEIIPTLTKYNPIPTDIKTATYVPFVVSVRTAMTPFNTAEGKFTTCQNETQVIQDLVIGTTRKVRGVLFEIYTDNETYQDYNHIIDLITGDNVRKNSAKRKAEAEANPPADPNAPAVDFQSVSQQDRGSIYTFFTTLIDELSLDVNYLPNEPELKTVGLKTLRDDFGLKLKELAKLEGEFNAQEAIIQPLFVGPSSLHDRAERSKVHIKRQYGVDSIEYKSVTGKKY
jgi:hypothetical protein